MKTEQVALVSAIAECGSITKAAEKLYLSQPNACHMLNALEHELGYVLFTRARSGTELTEKGEEFMKYAGTLRRTLERITALGSKSENLRFTLLTYRYAFSENAFIRLCSEHMSDAADIVFKMCPIYNLSDAAEQLEQGNADIAIGICRDDLFGAFEKQFQRAGLVTEYLATMPLHITVSSAHPLASREEFKLTDYLQYPCITSVGMDSPENYASSTITDYTPFISKMIYAEPGTAKIELAISSNGFLVSTPFTPSALRQYDLVSKPIANSNVRLFALLCRERSYDSLLLRYIELLRDEREWPYTV